MTDHFRKRCRDVHGSKTEGADRAIVYEGTDARPAHWIRPSGPCPADAAGAARQDPISQLVSAISKQAWHAAPWVARSPLRLPGRWSAQIGSLEQIIDCSNALITSSINGKFWKWCVGDNFRLSPIPELIAIGALTRIACRRSRDTNPFTLILLSTLPNRRASELGVSFLDYCGDIAPGRDGAAKCVDFWRRTQGRSTPMRSIF
jgi:hypothetical protein